MVQLSLSLPMPGRATYVLAFALAAMLPPILLSVSVSLPRRAAPAWRWRPARLPAQFQTFLPDHVWRADEISSDHRDSQAGHEDDASAPPRRSFGRGLVFGLLLAAGLWALILAILMAV